MQKKYIPFVLYILVCFVVDTYAADGPFKLRDLEPLLVQVVYFVWAFCGIFFGALLVWIGIQYMMTLTDTQKKQELADRGKRWLISLLIVGFCYPAIAGIYDFFGIGKTNPECYEDIATPGFHFFFPNVCTDPSAGGEHGIGAVADKGVIVKDTLPSDRCIFTPHNKEIVLPVNEQITISREIGGVVLQDSCGEYENDGSGNCRVVAVSNNACPAGTYELKITDTDVELDKI